MTSIFCHGEGNAPSSLDRDFQCCIQLLQHFVVKNKNTVIIHLSSIVFLTAVMIHVQAISEGWPETQIVAFLAVTLLFLLVSFYVQKTSKWVTTASITCHSLCILHVVFLKT